MFRGVKDGLDRAVNKIRGHAAHGSRRKLILNTRVGKCSTRHHAVVATAASVTVKHAHGHTMLG